MGQPVIVENRPGANMVIGGAECAKAAPDGYTLCVVSPDTMSFNPFTVPNLPYDPDKDFRPVTNMYYVVEGLVAKQALAANSVDELRALAAARPGALNFGTLGARTTTDMYRLWLGEFWKTSFVGVPYKGGSEIIAALLAGTIDVSKIGVGNMAGQLDEKKLKVLALRSSGRNARLRRWRKPGSRAFRVVQFSGDWWCRRRRPTTSSSASIPRWCRSYAGRNSTRLRKRSSSSLTARAPSSLPRSSRRTGSMPGRC